MVFCVKIGQFHANFVSVKLDKKYLVGKDIKLVKENTLLIN